MLGGWYNDSSQFPYDAYVWFYRSGTAGSENGMFSFHNFMTDYGSFNVSTRAALISLS